MKIIKTKRRKKKNTQLSLYVGMLIRKVRIKNGLSGVELGNKLYLSQQQISRYERGDSGCQLDFLFRLFSVLNMTDTEIERFFLLVIEQNKKSGKRNLEIKTDSVR